MKIELLKSDDSSTAKGARLAYLIDMSGLSLAKLSERAGVGYSTLRQWRSGYRNLTNVQAQKLNEIFSQEGIIINTQWLMNGEGRKPYYADPNKNIPLVKKPEDSLHEEIELFKKNQINTILLEIPNHSMLPAFKPGTWVGGICLDREELKKAHKNLCIVDTKDYGVFCRAVHKVKNENCYAFSCLNLTNKSDDTIFIKERRILKMAPVSRMWCF